MNFKTLTQIFQRKGLIYLLILFVLITLTFSCNFTKDPAKNATFIKRVYIEEPKLSWIGTDSQAIYFGKQLGLDEIRKGYDSLQLRVTYSYGHPQVKGDSSVMLVIKNRLGNWDAEMLLFVPDYPPRDSIFYTVISKRRNLVPVSGWEGFIKRLFSYKLLNKPFEKIEEGQSILHGPNGIIMELATKSKYIEYSYYVPDFYVNKYWQIEELKGIVELLQFEFGFNDPAAF